MMEDTGQKTVVIANATAASADFNLRGRRIVAVIKPAAWTDADISFEVETARGSDTFVKVVDNDGALVKLDGISTTVAECHLVSGATTDSDKIITSPGQARVVSTNTASEADLNQGAARTLVVLTAPL